MSSETIFIRGTQRVRAALLNFGETKLVRPILAFSVGFILNEPDQQCVCSFDFSREIQRIRCVKEHRWGLIWNE